MKFLAPTFALLGCIGLSLPALASSSLGPAFSVVDLGASYQLQTDANGTAYSVTGASGGPAYAFDKSPTTSIYETYGADGVSQFPYVHSGGFLTYTLQNGSVKGGYLADPFSGPNDGYLPHVPIGTYFQGTWHNELMSPVSDMNANGEFVGTSVIGKNSYYGVPTYAAFSTATGQTHDWNGSSIIVDNLNNYIASSLGINLTEGLKVDDLGRIIAQGTIDGQTQDFLLTPAGLSSAPIPAPEPTALALLAVASVGWIVRNRFRR